MGLFQQEVHCYGMILLLGFYKRLNILTALIALGIFIVLLTAEGFRGRLSGIMSQCYLPLSLVRYATPLPHDRFGAVALYFRLYSLITPPGFVDICAPFEHNINKQLP